MNRGDQKANLTDGVSCATGGLAVGSIGDTLRNERLRRGLELDQLAAQTKIGPCYLQAIEENRFDRLPGGLFTRSFLRQYEHALGLEDDQPVLSLQQQLERPPVLLPGPQRNNKLSRVRRIPAAVWLIVTILGGGVVSKLWENPNQELHQTSASGARSKVKEVATARSRSTEVQAVASRATSESGSGPEFAAMRVAFTASEPVWVSIKSDGIHTYSGTLDRQQSKQFTASNRMTVLVGNAGGLAISMNGKPVELVGAHGEVQLLELTPDGARVNQQQRTGQ
jgi:cytoskeleton protein RodZ